MARSVHEAKIYQKVCVTCGKTFIVQNKEAVEFCSVTCLCGADMTNVESFNEKFSVLDEYLDQIWGFAWHAVNHSHRDKDEYVAEMIEVMIRAFDDEDEGYYHDDEFVATVRLAASEAFDAQLNNASARAGTTH
jgi:hypothetical protein